MKIIAGIFNTLKTAAWILMVPVLAVVAILQLVYSPWSQEYMRRYAVAMLHRQGIEARIDALSLSFPLNVEAEGIRIAMQGPQTIEARNLTAKLSVMPLLAGEVELRTVQLTDGAFTLGAPDSAMLLTVRGREIVLDDARMALTTMDIDIDKATLRRGRVALTLNQWITPAPSDTATTTKTDLKIKVKRLDVDGLTYDMRMLPTIDSLGARIPNGTVLDFALDLKKQTIGIASFMGRGLDASYIAPDSATIAATPPIPVTTSSSDPWTVKIDTIGFVQSKALYTTRGLTPQPGLDFAYIQADSLALGISHFFNRASEVVIPIKFSATERCGVNVSATGTVRTDSVATRIEGFDIATRNGTALAASALIGMGDLFTQPSLPLAFDVDGTLAAADAKLMFPLLSPYFTAMGQNARIETTADVTGTAGNLDVSTLRLGLPGMAHLAAEGKVQSAFDPDNIGGNLALRGEIIDINNLKPMLMTRTTAAEVNIPRTLLHGRVDMHRGEIKGALKAVTGGGDIALDADWNSRREKYDLHVAADKFPVNAFLPKLGVGQLSATLTASGQGYDPMSKHTSLSADVAVHRAVYQGYTYGNVKSHITLHDGQAKLDVACTDPNAQFTLAANGNLTGATYDWQASLNGGHIDLQALRLVPDEAVVTAVVEGKVSISPSSRITDAQLDIRSLTYRDKVATTSVRGISATLHANDSLTNLTLRNRDLCATAKSRMPLDTIMSRMTGVTQVLAQQIKKMKVDVESLQKALPKFEIDLNAGTDNFLTDLMAESKTTFRSLHMTAENDSSLSMQAQMYRLAGPTLRLDTITFDLAQYGDRLVFDGRVENAPGTFDEWAHVDVAGFVFENRLGMRLNQLNIKGEEGYNIGLDAVVADSTVTVAVNPVGPTIAYMPWTVNEDNFIRYSFAHKHFDANLHMHSPKSSLAIYTDHVADSEGQEEVVVDINDIDIADWIRLNPFAPGYAGKLSADMRVRYEDHNVNGHGTVTLADFTYDRRRVGTLRSDMQVSTDLSGRLRAVAELFVDGQKTVDVRGALNDSTSGSPLAMDLSLIHFPLQLANPFMPQGVATMRGSLNGSMQVSGSGLEPKLDGWVQFDSAAVRVAMMGTEYAFNNVRIPVEHNVVQFNNFAISGTNSNPLTVSGSVDMHSMVNPRVDLKFNAQNMQIVNTTRAARGATVYGKGFVNLNATVQGDMNFMDINAALSVLAGTNITYVMADAATVLAQQQNENMVKFVNFSDTLAVAEADSLQQSGLAMMVNATLTVQSGSTINVDLSSTGRNRVSIQPEGTVDFSMLPFSTPRLTGRINFPKGFARYTPPFMTEKVFQLQPDSYVAFNGDMMNPTLNLQAVDVVRANVTQTGQNSRMVNFDVSLGVTGTLDNMNVTFDLGTDDDITVANELQAMSQSQRANQAMNMLLYNVYSGPGTRGDSNLSGNMVYSYLASQLNNWAAGAIKGVDLTFGVDQYDRTVAGNTSQTTSYTYQVSKSLFNDRFKIVVGGNYSTDANADENFSQNLIKDISFEYFLNKAQTMYVRLFRHTGYESILEGEITKTGVGFVYKRKSGSLRGVLGLRRHRSRQSVQQPADTISQPSDSTHYEDK